MRHKVFLCPRLALPYTHLFFIFFLQFDYFNSLLINTVDEEGNPIPLGGEFLLEKNEHFNKLPVNTQQSNIQVPTNVYNRGNKIIKPGFTYKCSESLIISKFVFRLFLQILIF